MHTYYANGRLLWVVRNTNGRLVGRFSTKQQAEAFIASYKEYTP
jgi:hypothetical protein